MELLKYLVFIILIIGTIQASKPEDSTYFVGLVEFARKFSGKPEEQLDYNLKGYREILQNNVVAGDKVDIIVFPEFQLSQVEDELSVFAPDPKDKKILCEKDNPNRGLLSELSCWASTFNKYLVINLIEKENCTDKSQCTSNGLTKYNVNVIFDRTGALIALYRKHNLYIEAGLNATKTPDMVTFETDFGVKFGTFICFDIIFYAPAQELVKMGVTDFVYTTMWFGELPFATANQFQFAWSYANDVNFLVSGGNLPIYGVSGTGAFGGKNGEIKYEIFGTTQNRMVIAEVPKKKSNTKYEIKHTKKAPAPVPERLMGLKVTRDPTIDMFEIADVDQTNIDQTICKNDFCCKFQIKRIEFPPSSDQQHYSFKMGAYTGKKSLWETKMTHNMEVSICAIFACTDPKNFTTCGTTFPDDISVINKYYFDEIIIEADFKKSDKRLIMPNSVDQQFKSLNVPSFDFNITEKGDKTNVIFKLKEPNSDLLTFGIYTSYFNEPMNN